MNSQIYAKVLADSVTLQQHRLITLEIQGPKFLDAEWGKHRMLSQNSSSDRAIPVNRTAKVAPYLPIDIRVAGPGMQQANQVDHQTYLNFRLANEILHAGVVTVMEHYKDAVHKQHVNRLNLPWALQKKVVTATKEQWLYFGSLRDHEAADPNMQLMAVAARRAIYESTPTERTHTWHLPYILKSEYDAYPVEILARVSGARCSRVSYDNLDGSTPDIEKDIKSAQQRIDDKHWTPFEHQAYPMDFNPGLQDKGITHIDRYGEHWSANFRGWIQFRKTLDC